MSAEDVSELTFRFQDRQDGSVKVLPINHETLADPKFTIGILNTTICDNPEIGRLLSMVRTQTYHRLLRYAIAPADKTFTCQVSALELISMTDRDLQKAGISDRCIEVFRTATQTIKERFLEKITT